jgi:hypothetical protein
MSIILGFVAIVVFLWLFSCSHEVLELLESEESPIFKYLAIGFTIGIFLLTIYVNFSKLNIDDVAMNNFSEFFRGLFNSDDKIKFLLQNDSSILFFLFIVFGGLLLTIWILWGVGIVSAFISAFFSMLIYLPCRYFYLMFRGDKSIIRNARAKSDTFKFFEFLIWGLITLIIVLIYLKAKNSYLSS